MPRVTRKWSLTVDEAELLAAVCAEVTPSGDYDCPETAWEAQELCFERMEESRIAADGGDDVAADLLAHWDHIVRSRFSQAIQDDVRREHQRQNALAEIDVLVPEGVTVHTVRFDPFRAVPQIDAEGQRLGVYQISFIFRVARPEFDAAVNRLIAIADGAAENKAAGLRLKAQWDRHPEAETLLAACEADGIDPMSFQADVDQAFGQQTGT